MRPISQAKRQGGFTLIEVLVVAPIVLLVIASIVMVVVNLTGSAMRAQARAQLQNEVLAVLDQMEQDVKITTEIDDTYNFQLSLVNIATNRNPLDINRRLIKKDCTVAEGGLAAEEVLKYVVAYEAHAGTLYRRVSLTTPCTASPDVWQRHDVDEKIISNADIKLRVEYNTDGAASTNVVSITLTATRKIAGEEISFTGSMYVKSLNIH